jgi:hypothetical protein
MNLLALALLQGFSFGAPVAPPAAPAIAAAPRANAVEKAHPRDEKRWKRKRSRTGPAIQ